MKADEERVMDVAYEHVTLGHDVGRLVLLEHVGLAQHLDRVQLLFRLVTRQKHLQFGCLVGV